MKAPYFKQEQFLAVILNNVKFELAIKLNAPPAVA